MSQALNFEAEPFELSPPESGEKTCGCAKCQKSHEREYREDDEITWESGLEELNWESSTVEDEYGSAPVPRLPTCSLWPGTTWEKICWTQNVLNRAARERLTVDGRYGPLSCAAAQRFQTANRLTVDGIVGPQTETALIQAALNELARQSLVAVNGVMDVRTVQEITRFQTAQRLLADGRVGPVTRAAMTRALGGQACPPAPAPAPRPPREREPHQIPLDPKPPVGSPKRNCEREQFNRLVNECNQLFLKCAAARCGVTHLVDQLKLVPALAGCIRLGNPYAIILCVLAKGGKTYIDNVFRAMGCADTCKRNLGFCRQNAQSQASCF